MPTVTYPPKTPVNTHLWVHLGGVLWRQAGLARSKKLINWVMN